MKTNNLTVAAFQIVRDCFAFGIAISLILSMFSVMVDQVEFADFLLRQIAVSIAIVCVPLLAILAIAKRINK